MADFPEAIIETQGYLDPHISIEEGNLVLNEAVWDDLRIPVSSVKVPASNAPIKLTDLVVDLSTVTNARTS
jgi:hypothetical protein